jgi:hypothetical protein
VSFTDEQLVPRADNISRTDRQDGMELLAKTTNLSLTYQPGVRTILLPFAL